MGCSKSNTKRETYSHQLLYHKRRKISKLNPASKRTTKRRKSPKISQRKRNNKKIDQE
jgi:hypothetical protein